MTSKDEEKKGRTCTGRSRFFLPSLNVNTLVPVGPRSHPTTNGMALPAQAALPKKRQAAEDHDDLWFFNSIVKMRMNRSYDSRACQQNLSDSFTIDRHD
jgi:hypothetical protein